jgi:amidase
MDGSSGRVLLPATVIPVGLKNGLPVGIQIVGAYLEDRTTLDLADQMLTLLGSPPRPPGF